MLLCTLRPQYPTLHLILVSKRFSLAMGSILFLSRLTVTFISVITRSYLFSDMVLRIGDMLITGNGFLEPECVLMGELELRAYLLLAMLIIFTL